MILVEFGSLNSGWDHEHNVVGLVKIFNILATHDDVSLKRYLNELTI